MKICVCAIFYAFSKSGVSQNNPNLIFSSEMHKIYSSVSLLELCQDCMYEFLEWTRWWTKSVKLWWEWLFSWRTPFKKFRIADILACDGHHIWNIFRWVTCKWASLPPTPVGRSVTSLVTVLDFHCVGVCGPSQSVQDHRTVFFKILFKLFLQFFIVFFCYQVF